MQKPGLVILIVVQFSLIVATYAQSPSTKSRIRVDGNRFVMEDGTPIVFRGLNTSDPDKLDRSGHWNEVYFDEIRKWGANIVRFPVHPSAWRNRGRDEYLRLLDKGVELAAKNGLYVIIDWHSIGNLKTEMYQHDMYETTRKETYEFWRTIAKHYKDNTAVAFFELFNEPTVIHGELGTCSWAEWKAMMEEIITIIRSTGNKAVPLIAGFNWAYDLTEAGRDPVDAKGVGYVSHPYPQKREKPWEEKWTADWGFLAERYPLMLTEIGFCGPDDVGAHIPVISDETYGEAITRYTSDRGISWLVWVFDPNWSPMMFSDWKFTPTRQGKFFQKALSTPSKK